MPLKRSSSWWFITMRTLSNRPNTTDSFQALCHTTFWMASSTTLFRLPRIRIWSHLWNLLQTFLKLRSRTCILRPWTNSPSFCTSRWSQTPTCSTSMNSCHCRFTSISPLTFQSLRTLEPQTYLQLDTPNPFKQFPALTYLPASTSETLSFAKGGKSWKQVSKRSCLGTLYMANSQSIQNHCRFKIA